MIFDDMVLKRHATGSRYICNPPPTDTDNDTVILVNGFFDWKQALLAEGWSVEDGAYPHQDMKFSSFRKGEENYIITELDWFYNSFVIATLLAKDLKANEKPARIQFFEAVERACRRVHLDGFLGEDDIEPADRVDLNFGVQNLDGEFFVVRAEDIIVDQVHPVDHQIMIQQGFLQNADGVWLRHPV